MPPTESRCYPNGDGEKMADYKAFETTPETGVVNQYDATLQGYRLRRGKWSFTCCKACFLSGEKLTLRLNEIWNYSALRSITPER